jgi:nicotinate-nucleotide adenylyltransferase
MRIGVLGGSFDPVHLGHVGVARAVADALGLERVLFMPAAQAPLRDFGVRASGAHRAEMVRRAISEAGDERLELCELELERGGTSFTAETLRVLKRQRPNDDVVWIVGDDQFTRLGSWREPEELARLAEWAVYARPGEVAMQTAVIAGLRWTRVEAKAEWAISSSEVRARLAKGESVVGLLADNVIEYIRETGLYRGQ